MELCFYTPYAAQLSLPQPNFSNGINVRRKGKRKLFIITIILICFIVSHFTHALCFSFIRWRNESFHDRTQHHHLTSRDTPFIAVHHADVRKSKDDYC
jgi:hypothetical protein